LTHGKFRGAGHSALHPALESVKNATPHLGVRLIQAEYFMTNFASVRENGARISTGVVFRL